MKTLIRTQFQKPKFGLGKLAGKKHEYQAEERQVCQTGVNQIPSCFNKNKRSDFHGCVEDERYPYQDIFSALMRFSYYIFLFGTQSSQKRHTFSEILSSIKKSHRILFSRSTSQVAQSKLTSGKHCSADEEEDAKRKSYATTFGSVTYRKLNILECQLMLITY